MIKHFVDVLDMIHSIVYFTFNKLILKINYVVHPILKGKRAKNLYIQPIGPFPFERDEFFKILQNFFKYSSIQKLNFFLKFK